MRFGLVLILAVCLFLQGCHSGCRSSEQLGRSTLAPIVKKEKINYIGSLPATPAGESVALVNMKAATSDSEMFVFTGNLAFKGKIKPENAGESMPETVRFELRKKSTKGQVQTSQQFDVSLETDGTIKTQKFPFTNALLVNAKESLEVAIIPVDGDLPASDATLKFTYTPPAGSALETAEEVAEEEELEALSTGVKKFVLNYNGLLAPTPKGIEQGHFRFMAVAGLTTPPIGNLNVKGKFISQEPRPLPTQVQLIVKFTTSKGNVLATERYDITVEADGKIPLQKFPLNTTVALGTEALQFSTLSVDRDFPLTSANIKVFFTQS